MTTPTLSRTRCLPEVALATVVLLYARMPERILHGFLWAEDVRVFLKQAYELGAKSIVTPYAGYLHLLPRVIAYVFSLAFPITAAPRVFALACMFVTVGSAVWLFRIASRALPTPAATVIALSPVLVPSTGEVWLSITNLQWILAPLLLALLWEEFWADAGRSTARRVAIIVLSFTGPFAIFFAPFTLFSTIRRHRGFAYLLLPLAQINVTIWSGFTQQTAGHPPLSYLRYDWIEQAARHLVFDFFVPQTVNHWELAAMACAVVIVLGVLSLRRNGYVCWALLAFALALWASGIVRSGAWGDEYLSWSGGGARFFYVPAVFIAWTLVIAAVRSESYRARLGSSVMLILMLLVGQSAFRVPPAIDSTFTKTGAGWIVSPAPEGWQTPILSR